MNNDLPDKWNPFWRYKFRHITPSQPILRLNEDKITNRIESIARDVWLWNADAVHSYPRWRIRTYGEYIRKSSNRSQLQAENNKANLRKQRRLLWIVKWWRNSDDNVENHCCFASWQELSKFEKSSTCLLKEISVVTSS